MIESISAITLATHDMARAVRFYRMLGFEVIYGGDDAAFTSFRAGTSYLNLIAQRPSECGPGGDASRGMKRRMRPSIALRPGPAAEWRSRIGANPSCRANHLATGRSCGTRLDRLARSTRDLLNVIAALTERGAGFKSLKDTWADTTSPHGRLMLTVLGGLAEFERELIRARTGEGRKRAKDRGVKFGRPAALTPRQRQKALQRLANGNAQVDIARAFNVSQATISRLASL